MSVWDSEFKERRAEIDLYFSFVQQLEIEGKAEESLLKTVKATGFLLLYNLIEASMRNGILAIVDELKAKRICFDEVRIELKRIALENHEHLPKDFAEIVSDFAREFLISGFKDDKLFSGNVDARRIRKTAEQYGFSADTDHDKTKGGTGLLTVKTNRNDLGHGTKSFAEVGRNYSASGLVALKDEVCTFMESILVNIDTYLKNREYLAKNSNQVDSLAKAP